MQSIVAFAPIRFCFATPARLIGMGIKKRRETIQKKTKQKGSLHAVNTCQCSLCRPFHPS